MSATMLALLALGPWSCAAAAAPPLDHVVAGAAAPLAPPVAAAPAPVAPGWGDGCIAPRKCVWVNVVGVTREGDPASQWEQGLRFFMERVNLQGGLRLGEGVHGILNMSILHVNERNVVRVPECYAELYKGLCREPEFIPSGDPPPPNCDGFLPWEINSWRDAFEQEPALYLTPPNVEDPVTAPLLKLSLLECSGRTLLASSEVLFPVSPEETWSDVFSVYGQESDMLAPSPDATNPIEFLHSLGVQNVSIAGVEVIGWDKMISSMELEMERVNATYLKVDDYKSGAALTNRVGPTALPGVLQEAADLLPEALVIIGNAEDTLQNTLAYFADVRKRHVDRATGAKATGYSPPAAFFMGGLAVTPTLQDNSFNYKHEQFTSDAADKDQWENCNHADKSCWSYDQWMGFVPWTADMPHAGPTQWPLGLDNPYDVSPDLRYLGSALDFAKEAQPWIRADCTTSCKSNCEVKCDKLEPTYYHAKAAASLLLFQMAIELSPSHGGYGMPLEDLMDATKITASMRTMNSSLGVETFWGPISFGSEHGGNIKYEIGIGQFQKNSTAPTLVNFKGKPVMDKTTSVKLVKYPAVWPDWCLVNGPMGLTGACPSYYLHKMDLYLAAELILTFVVVVVAGCVCVCWRKKQKGRSSMELQTVKLFHGSVLGTTLAPDVQLTDRDVKARWVQERMRAQLGEHVQSPPIPGIRKARRVHGQSRAGRVPVMFEDMRELQPSNWQDALAKRQIGSGSFGTVYRAEWRGKKVAVKVVRLPTEPDDTSDTVRVLHKEAVQKVTNTFVREVDVCCELVHPNLVETLGYYATEPGLFIVQELLDCSLDMQLYEQYWRPAPAQVLKAAFDIAKGMSHMHTHFVSGSTSGSGISGSNLSQHESPVIHRDLKSFNILLDRRPPLMGDAKTWEIVMKVADFGLARDLKESNDMTVCGTLLWSAPELLNSENYDEKVDVYSFAMTLVELIHGTKPWEDTKDCDGKPTRPHDVPQRVCEGQRPESQLEEATPEMSQLIMSCWDQEPAKRPTFPEVVETVAAMCAVAHAADDPVNRANVLQNYVGQRVAEHNVDNPGAGGDGAGGSPPMDAVVIHMEPEPEPEAERGTATSVGVMSTGTDDTSYSQAEMSIGGRSTATSSRAAAAGTSF